MNVSNGSSTLWTSYKPTKGELLIQVVVLVTDGLLTILGNIFVAAIVKLDHRLHKPTFYFLVNLAFADMVAGLLYTPFYTVAVFKQQWVFGPSWCRGHAFVISLSFNASLATLAVVSIDRFLDITDPLRYYGRMTNKKACVLLVAIWTHSTVWAAGPLVGWGELVRDTTTNTCRPNFAAQGSSGKIYAMLLAIIAFGLPIAITVYSYARIFRVADKQEKQIQKDMASVHAVTGQDSWPRERKAHKTILIIIGAFVVCWLPYTVGTCWKIFTGTVTAPYWFANLGLTLALFNSCVNPIVYTLRDKRFRRGARKILFGCGRQQKSYQNERDRTLSLASTSRTTTTNCQINE